MGAPNVRAAGGAGEGEGASLRAEVGLTSRILGAAITVHRELVPGLLESTYRACLVHELALRGLEVEIERPVPLNYRGVQLECGFRLDLVVSRRVVVELKAIRELGAVHVAQLITYLRLSKLPVGLLINFNVLRLRDGIRRLTPLRPPDPSA